VTASDATAEDSGSNIYAVHYRWIPDHAMQGPVGIWNEAGDSYYPEVTAHLRGSGAPPSGKVPTHFTFVGWLEMKSESTGTYENWSRVDSDLPMQVVLDELQTEFFSVAHPVKSITVADTEVSDPDESADSYPTASKPVISDPANRRVIAESWWIASELVARHPDHVVYEMHPAGGSYDCLAIRLPTSAHYAVMLNRVGSIQVLTTGFGVTWHEALAAASPHDLVKRIEREVGLELRGKRPPTTSRTLAYRVIAAFLELQVNDRFFWDARCEFLDSSDGYAEELNGYLAGFPAAQAALAGTPRLGLPHEPESHFWALLRDDEPVAIISMEGYLYVDEQPVELLRLYQESRSVINVVVSTLGRWLR
jgi:hypothetical protein